MFAVNVGNSSAAKNIYNSTSIGGMLVSARVLESQVIFAANFVQNVFLHT